MTAAAVLPYFASYSLVGILAEGVAVAEAVAAFAYREVVAFDVDLTAPLAAPSQAELTDVAFVVGIAEPVVAFAAGAEALVAL